jgi:hypothetical protein
MVLGMLAGAVTTAHAQPLPGAAGELAGHWEGVAQLPDDAMSFAVDFRRSTTGALSATIDIPDSGILRLPLRDVQAADGTVRFALPYGDAPIPFSGRLEADTIRGQLSVGPANAPFRLERQPTPRLPYREEPIAFSNGPVRLSGSLLVPQGRGPHPFILFQQSTHPETRQPWLYWADWFARRGIGGLIYDNRGTGASTGSPRVPFQQIAGDGLAALSLLKARRDVGPVGLFAVSQGGWVASLVAARAGRRLAFVAMVSGPGTSIGETVLVEARRELEARHFAPAEVEAGVAAKRRIERMIVAGASDDAIDAARAEVSGERWFQHIGIMPRGHWQRQWWRQVGGFDPAPYWRRVNIPVLNLYGGRDKELDPRASMSALAAAFAGRRNRLLTQLMFEEADHALTVPKGMRPVRLPAAMERLTRWVQRQVGAPRNGSRSASELAARPQPVR